MVCCILNRKSGWQRGPIIASKSCRTPGNTFWILTVQSHIMVGEDRRPVPLGSASDHHMQHPVRSLDIMFLWHMQRHKLTWWLNEHMNPSGLGYINPTFTKPPSVLLKTIKVFIIGTKLFQIIKKRKGLKDKHIYDEKVLIKFQFYLQWTVSYTAQVIPLATVFFHIWFFSSFHSFIVFCHGIFHADHAWFNIHEGFGLTLTTSGLKRFPIICSGYALSSCFYITLINNIYQRVVI